MADGDTVRVLIRRIGARALDAYGAKAFGYPTSWVNRSGLPSETLGAPADAIVSDMNGLVGFVR